MRQIFLDTETTGFDFKLGNRVIEFGAVECIDRKLTGNNLHLYFKPDCEMEEGAFNVHGISLDFLSDKPIIDEKIDEIMEYISGAELVIHNAGFDVPFLNYELGRVKKNIWGKIEDHCSVLDTLKLARKKHPGQRNSLDALCKRYEVSNAHRELHGALLDSELLAKVYLAMTGGQTDLMFSVPKADRKNIENANGVDEINMIDTSVLRAVELSDNSKQAHNDYLRLLTDKKGENITW
jgi:DNA polymerase-3 subunit epsilon